MISAPDKLDADTASLAQELCVSVSGSSMGLLKEMLATIDGMKFSETVDYAANMQAAVRMTEEYRKGVDGLLTNKTTEW